MSIRDVFLCLLFVVLSALSFIVQKIALVELSVSEMAFIRMLFLAVGVIFLFKSPPKKLPIFIMIALTGNILCVLLIGFALQTGINLAVTATLVQTKALFGVFFAALFFKEKPKISALIGILIAGAGICLLAGVGIQDFAHLKGVFLLLGASCSWALSVSLMKKYNVATDTKDVIWLAVISAIILQFIFEDVSFSAVPALLQQTSAKALICIAVAAYCSTLLVTIVFVRLTQKYESQAVMPYMLLMPVFSGLLAWGVFDEVPQPNKG